MGFNPFNKKPPSKDEQFLVCLTDLLYVLEMLHLNDTNNGMNLDEFEIAHWEDEKTEIYRKMNDLILYNNEE